MFITKVKFAVRFFILLLIIKTTKNYMQASKIKPIISLKKYENGYTCSSGGVFTTDPLVFLTTNNKYINQKTTSAYRKLEGLDENNFNCDFINNSSCLKSWTNQNWKVSKAGDHGISPVIDERWEEFDIHAVGINNINELIKVDDTDYFIALSVNSYEQPQIVLCENITKNKSTQCVWITLNEIDGHDIGIILRKCRALSFNPFSNKDSGCKRLSKMHINDEIKPSWRHFIIYKQADYMVFEEYNRKETLIEYRKRILLNDFNPKFALKYIYFKNIQWKEHKFKYLSFDTKNTGIQFGSTYKSKISHILCISLYTAMCITCELAIDVGSNKITNISNDEEIIHPTWKNIRLSVLIEKDKEYRFYMYGSNKNEYYDSFWAIDNVRYCHDNDTRDVKLNFDKELPDIFCQDLNYPNWKTTLEGTESTETEKLSYSFDNNNKLNLTWIYPSANGEFNITITQISTDTNEPNNFTRTKNYKKKGEQEEHSYTFEDRIPLSSTYLLTICIEENCFINTEINTPAIIPELKDRITLENGKINNTINLTIPGINLKSKTRYSFMYIVVCEISKKLSDNLNHKEKLYLSIIQKVNCSGVSWIAAELEASNDTIYFLVGDSSTKYSNNFMEPLVNIPMIPTKSYEWNVVLMNIYKDEAVFNILNAKKDIQNKNITSYWILIAIGFALLGFIIWICVKERNRFCKKWNQNETDSEAGIDEIELGNMLLNS